MPARLSVEGEACSHLQAESFGETPLEESIRHQAEPLAVNAIG